MFTVAFFRQNSTKAVEIQNIVSEKHKEKHEKIMEEVAFIKQNLLDIGCPLIQESEDLEQIETLLTTPSDHKQQLIQWILQEVSDEVVGVVELNSKAKTFGFDFNTLNGWTMSLKVIKAKLAFSNAGDDGLRSSRHYLEFIHQGGFALPIKSSNG